MITLHCSAEGEASPSEKGSYPSPTVPDWARASGEKLGDLHPQLLLAAPHLPDTCFLDCHQV
jgi:hypothetical protein